MERRGAFVVRRSAGNVERVSLGAGDLGIHTFPEDNNYKIGGGAAWGWYSYDPELKYVYYSTGNPGLWSPSYRCGAKTHEECNSGKWDNKWSMTIFARKVDSGEVIAESVSTAVIRGEGGFGRRQEGSACGQEGHQGSLVLTRSRGFGRAIFLPPQIIAPLLRLGAD